MTEYWKSQARKYCDFCKCWLADNKVSISFHENGKRHKENVQKHIAQLSKKSAKDHKQQEKVDSEIKKMEAAAMVAYLKDVQNNADLTSQSINEMLGKGTETNSAPEVSKQKSTAWHEVKSDQGNYFWNTETNETTWDPPDNYLSLAQQEEAELRKRDNVKLEKKKKESIKKQKQKEVFEEVNAYMSRESNRPRAARPLPSPSPRAPLPAPRDAPYAPWTAVITQPKVEVDLQLPQVASRPPPPVLVPPEDRIHFKEKKLDQSLGDGPVEFKKRKFNNPKRNTRQKITDE